MHLGPINPSFPAHNSKPSASYAGVVVITSSSGLIDTTFLGTGTANSTTFLRGDGTWAVPGGGGSPGGSDGQIQVNVAGVFGAYAGLAWDAVNDRLQVSGNGPHVIQSNQEIDLDAKGGVVYIGDVGAVSNSTLGTFDDAGQTITLRSNHGLTQMGDTDALHNQTSVRVNDTTEHIELDASVTVIMRASGLYIKDTGGDWYQWQSVSGVWTGTNVGATLP